MTLETYIEQYQQGDTDAFAQVYVESCQPLFVYAKYLEKDNDKAEDLLQDTYIEIMKSVGSLQHPEAFMTWSKTIMSRLYKKQFSGKGSLESTIKDEEQAASLFDQIEDTDQTFMPAENLDEKALKEFVLEQVNDLPDQQRLAMFSFYYDKLPIKEIAGIMDVSENTVKAHLYQGRAAVKQKIEAYEEKHGIRMHSILPTPFLYELFKGIGDATANSLSTDFALKIYQGVAAKVAATGQALGANAVQTGMEAAGKLGGNAAQSGVKAATGKTVVGSGAAAAAGTASGAGAKVIAAVVAGLLALGGAGFGVHHLIQQHNTTGEQAAYETEKQVITPDNGGTSQAAEVKNKLEKMAAFDGFWQQRMDEVEEIDEGTGGYTFFSVDIDGDGSLDYLLYRLLPEGASDGNNQLDSICYVRNGKVIEDHSFDTDRRVAQDWAFSPDGNKMRVLESSFFGDPVGYCRLTEYEINDSGLDGKVLEEDESISEEEFQKIADTFAPADWMNSRSLMSSRTAQYVFCDSVADSRMFLNSQGIQVATSEKTYDSWQEAYLDYFSSSWLEQAWSEYVGYIGADDINKDGVPELFTHTANNDEADSWHFYTFVNGHVVSFPTLRGGAHQGGNIRIDEKEKCLYYFSIYRGGDEYGIERGRAYKVRIGDTGFQVEEMLDAGVEWSADGYEPVGNQAYHYNWQSVAGTNDTTVVSKWSEWQKQGQELAVNECKTPQDARTLIEQLCQ